MGVKKIQKTELCMCMRDVEISEMHTILKKIDKDFYGNGQPGMKRRFEQFEGGLKTLAFVLGPGCLIAIVLGIIALIR